MVLVIALALLSSAAAWAQSAADCPAFEVASVKPAKPGGPSRIDGGPGTNDPGRYTASNAELSWLVMRAWHIYPYQLSSVPTGLVGVIDYDHVDRGFGRHELEAKLTPSRKHPTAFVRAGFIVPNL